MIDRIDVFKISNFSFGWKGDCNGFVQQLKRDGESEGVIEKTSTMRGVYASYNMGTVLCEPIGTKYLKF